MYFVRTGFVNIVNRFDLCLSIFVDFNRSGSVLSLLLLCQFELVLDSDDCKQFCRFWWILSILVKTIVFVNSVIDYCQYHRFLSMWSIFVDLDHLYQISMLLIFVNSGDFFRLGRFRQWDLKYMYIGMVQSSMLIKGDVNKCRKLQGDTDTEVE